MPRLIRSSVESFIITFIMCITAIFHPSSIMTWGSVAAFAALISSACWWGVSKIWLENEKKKKARLKIGYFVFGSFVITVICALVLLLSFRYLSVYTDIMTSGVGETQYLICILFGGIASAMYVALTSELKSSMALDIEVMHVELFSTTSALCAIVFMVVSSISAYA